MSDRFRTQEDVFRFLDIVESKGVGNLIPFPDDLLFHFFNKKTEITDTYLLDPVSNLKLYPKKSGAVKATAANSCIPVSKTILTNTRKIRSVFKHKLSELNNFGYVWAGANVSSPYATTGLYLTSGKLAYSFYWFGSTAGACAINTSALQDDNFYLCTQTVGETNISMKMNKVTVVNNALVIGSDINSTTTAKGTEELTGSCFGILSACYSDGSYNFASGNQMVYIEFLDASDNVLLSFNFSEGAGQQVFDVISGNAYAIYNITESVFWNYTQDFNHYNFRYGFTLYQKAGADDIRIPNKKDQSEIVPVSVPSGYSRIANYKECRQTFNQCENVFKLDNTTVATVLRCATAGTADAIGDYVYNSTNSRWVNTTTGAYIYLQGGTEWYWKNAANILLYYGYASTSPANVVTWFRSGGAAPAPGQLQSVLITSDLYNADPDFVLFTESTGVAKEINIGTLDVNIGIDRGYLYINPNVSEHDFMLYGTDKTLKDDEKIIKYIGLKDEIVTDENGDVVYDENDHTILE